MTSNNINTQIKPSDILKAAKAKIADPEHWTQGEFVRSAKNRPVRMDSPRAAKWCAIGALRSIAGTRNGGWSDAFIFLDAASMNVSSEWRGITMVNDREDHATVMEMFDKAIEAAEKAGK